MQKGIDKSKKYSFDNELLHFDSLVRNLIQKECIFLLKKIVNSERVKRKVHIYSFNKLHSNLYKPGKENSKILVHTNNINKNIDNLKVIFQYNSNISIGLEK